MPQLANRARDKALTNRHLRSAARRACAAALEALESRRLMAATTVEIPVPAALDAEARMGPFVDLPGGFGPVWLLDTTGPTFEAGDVHGSVSDQKLGLMEFPLAGIPNGSRIDSAQLRYHVDFSTGSIEGGEPALRFSSMAGDGRITFEEVANPAGPERDRATVEADPGDGEHVVNLDAAAIERVIGRASHLKVVADGQEIVVITSADGAAASGVTPPTLVLTFTPPAQPAPPPAPYPTGTITGQTFIDADNDGTRDAGEGPATQTTVFLDADRDGVWDNETEFSTLTDAAGNYRFTGLSAGTYRVVQHPPSNGIGWRLTTAASVDVTLATDQSTAAAPAPFGLHTNTVQVHGTAFADADADGTRDAGDRPLAGRLIFVDENNDGVFQDDLQPDSGIIVEEKHTYTDANGNYFLYELNPGTHVIREDLPDGWRQTTPAASTARAHVVTLARGQVAAGRNFGSTPTTTTPSRPGPATLPQDGGSISGNVFDDLNNDGTRDDGEDPRDGAMVYIDENRNGVWDRSTGLGDFDEPWATADGRGNYRLAGLAPGTYRVGMPQADPVFGERVTFPASGFHDVTITQQNQAVTGKHFGIGDAPDPISGTVFNDEDGDGRRDPGEGPTDAILYLDLDRDGQWDDPFDGGEEEPQTFTNEDGTYGFTGVLPGTYRVRPLVTPERTVTAPAAGFYDVTVTEGGAPVTGRDFGIHAEDVPPPPPPEGATIAGTVFTDTDGDGARDPDEDVVRDGWVYLDLNRDGIQQDGINTPDSEVIEPVAMTNDQGVYQFVGVEAGTYHVRHNPSVDFVVTTPASGFYEVTVTQTSDVTGRHFGVQFVDPDPPAGDSGVTGTVFRDLDADGVQDAGEPGIEDARVYLDLDADIIYEEGEPYAITDAEGNYRFLELPAGEYRVCAVIPEGLQPTEPANAYHGVTLAAGEVVTGRNFGNAALTEPPVGGAAIEAEAARRSGAVRSTKHAGFTGSGFVDFKHASGDFVEFTLTAAEPGTYALDFRYANGSRAARTMDVVVNDRKVGTVTFAPTGSWRTWKTATFAAAELTADAASAGGNTVSLVASGQSGPNLDGLTLRAQPAPPPVTTPTLTTHQAESATHSGPVFAMKRPGFMGRGYLDFVNDADDFVEFDVDRATAGPYTLKFRYANGSRGARSMDMAVNGAARPGGLTFGTTGSWSTWETATVVVDLEAGPNTIRLTATGDGGPNLDRLTVTG